MRSRLLVAAALPLLAVPVARAEEKPPAQAAPSAEVSLEVRLVHLADDALERLGFKGPMEKATPLNDLQVRQLIEAAQGDRRTCIYQAPKVTLDSGKQATVDMTERQSFVVDVDITRKDGQVVAFAPKTEEKTTGLKMVLEPVVSADRRTVQVRLALEDSQLAEGGVPLFPCPVAIVPTHADGSKGKPVVFTQFIQQPRFTVQSVEKTATIPDGGTVVIGGYRKTVETRQEFGPPVLSKVPYVNRLFKNVGVGREACNVLVLVTPRVVDENGESRKVTCGAEEADATSSAKVVADLIAAYNKACADGRAADADRYARAALVLDPTCFHKRERR